MKRQSFRINGKRISVVQDTFLTLVAGGRPHFSIHNEFGSASMFEREDGTLYLDSIQIKTPHQGHGTVFLQALEARARKEGYRSLLLQAGSCENEEKRPSRQLVRWYKKRGYLAMPVTYGWLRIKKL